VALTARRFGASAFAGGLRVGDQEVPSTSAVAVDHAAGMGVEAVLARPSRVPGDRVRVASENPLRYNGDLRPVAAAGRLILISKHIDDLGAVVPCGPLDARALAVERVVGRAWPLADVGDSDASGRTLSPGRAASSVCCALLAFRSQDHEADDGSHPRHEHQPVEPLMVELVGHHPRRPRPRRATPRSRRRTGRGDATAVATARLRQAQRPTAPLLPRARLRASDDRGSPAAPVRSPLPRPAIPPAPHLEESIVDFTGPPADYPADGGRPALDAQACGH
jgi:hypothetical protein